MANRKKAKKPKPALVLGVLSVVLLVLVIIFFIGGGREKAKRFVDANIPKTPAVAGEPAEAKTVTLFFLDDDDDFLHRETRQIVAGPTDAEEAERALAELIKGSDGKYVSPLPPQTKVRQVFIGKNGVATVDFSRDIAEKFSYGSTMELAAVYAVVNTLAFNFKAVKKVVILVEGAEKETLGGHVDLTRAFLPDYSLVAR
ncbi:MAG: GerMN domain-containing protein [Candidatus Aminicenantes bacterium]|nr:GerMN domain-containing protein [Candidatus Aminicenantes bacterium]